MPPELGKSIERKANVQANGMLRSTMIIHETNAFEPAIPAVIPGNIKIPDPKTAPTYSAIPCDTEIVCFNDCDNVIISLIFKYNYIIEG